MYVIFLYNTFKTFIDNLELLRSEYFITEESIMDSTITTELLEKEIVRLREENKKLTDQLEFVCKNREIIQKSYAALEEKYNETVNSAKEMHKGVLHVHERKHNPGMYITCDLPDGESAHLLIVGYNKEKGTLETNFFEENQNIDLREIAKAARRTVTTNEAILDEAYRSEYPEEIITIREEAELKGEIETAENFYNKFVEFTGEEV